MKMPKQSGILLHLSSLPGPHGIGEIGPQAQRFVRELAAMGQSVWQILPVGPTGFGDSPYQSLSTYAGNHLLISFETLLNEELLVAADLADFPASDPQRVDFERIIPARLTVLERASSRFRAKLDSGEAPDLDKAFREFLARHDGLWLDNYALFAALKQEQGGRAWHQWPTPMARRHKRAMAAARIRCRAEIEGIKIVQFLFFRQWRQLRETCRQFGISLIGDLPIFVAHDSADVWSAPQLFKLDRRGLPTHVAGVPPDYFSQTGQRWGNPLYRWDRMARKGFGWWQRRMWHLLEMFDIVRIDHFRGFEAYWQIPADQTTALNGCWVKGPGIALFAALRRGRRNPAIIAEDLGYITPEVHQLRDRAGFPGMRVLQFVLEDPDFNGKSQLRGFRRRSVCYTGTHDNDTALGWFGNRSDQSRLLSILEGTPDEVHWSLMNLAWRSGSNLAIAPLQDVLGLDSRARMNEPGRERDNWRWRFTWEQLTSTARRRLRNLTQATGRAPLQSKAQ